MKEIKIYHNPRCSKSRMALAYLEEKGLDYRVIDYLKQVPSASELQEILTKLGIPAQDLVRRGEQEYKDLYKGKALSEEEWIRVMVKHPKLIERPIVVIGDHAVVARPTEKIDQLL